MQITLDLTKHPVLAKVLAAAYGTQRYECPKMRFVKISTTHSTCNRSCADHVSARNKADSLIIRQICRLVVAPSEVERGSAGQQGNAIGRWPTIDLLRLSRACLNCTLFACHPIYSKVAHVIDGRQQACIARYLNRTVVSAPDMRLANLGSPAGHE